jgi:hypothetical protein
MLLDLLRPFSYLTIEHDSNEPWWVNWCIPALVTAAIFGAGKLAGLSFTLFGSDGLVNLVLGFVQTLAGFYIAALAAIASFHSPDMDRLMPGKPPTMKVQYNGRPQLVQITRRRFLSSMFAYLTACSLLVTIVSIAAISLGKAAAGVAPVDSYAWIKMAFAFLYVFVFAQMISITLWGLYYLGERIHTPD